ncbi:MAG: Glycerol-3-phosphate dehydrogenase (NAD(P)+) [bacterium ADurb.Bin243]|nr:MAG: Glycerol-3-phosphate dehydrogenase (NAD(P)+) [bacterium ADurb.Bin243]
MSIHQTVSIIGAGAWGTTLACMIAQKGHKVKIWAYKTETCDDINRFRENREFLAGIAVPANVCASGDLDFVLSGSRFVILSSPSHTLRPLLKKISPLISDKNDFISVIKGIEEKNFMTVSEIVAEEFESIPGLEKIRNKIAVVSGPNLAREIAAGLPSTTVVAARSKKLREDAQQLLSTERFRAYTSEDVAGLEFGGSLKNIMAIGAGICDGLNYGDNTKSAFLTRALREMVMIGELKGARRETFYGLSGVGDLFATSFSKFSRNRSFGEKIALGMSRSQAEGAITGVAEGVHTARAAYLFGKKEKLEFPVINEIYKIIYDEKEPAESVMALMTRTLKGELE